MFLYDLFRVDFIKMDMEAQDKDEAFEELVDFMCHAAPGTNRKEILYALHEREAKMSTGIQKGIAIPHGKTGAADALKGVLGISRNGIEYDALDGQPVYLLFMIIAPLKDSEKHLRVLKRLTELLENPQFYTDLQSQKDPAGAHRVICKYEDMLISLDSIVK
jgi:PTS system fructose-specific IIC component/PTS system nitrogen regulatory IIA component